MYERANWSNSRNIDESAVLLLPHAIVVILHITHSSETLAARETLPNIGIVRGDAARIKLE